MNTVLSDKEIKLGQTKYFILQYLRGSSSKSYNSNDLAKKLELSERTVKQHIRDMKAMGVIEDSYNATNHVREIVVKDEWLQ